MNKKLNGRVALISGGAAGIGFATAQLFLEEGATVAICDVNAERIGGAVEELSKFGPCKGYTVDIANKEQVTNMVADIVKTFGKIEILINNAGITKDAQFYKMTDEQFEAVVHVNLMGTYTMCKAVVPYLMEQKYGKIVSCSSVSAYNGNFGQSNYAATKAAIMGMTRVMGKELGKYNITVNAIAPGSINTDMYKAVPEEIKEKKLHAIPLRRFGEPREAAQLLCFLASDESSYITAQTITVDGGFN